ncbi:LytR/AlgR family response regulator transcription factor [Fibrella aquatilis]|uniref:Response regulator transcription factor n=1 Tax=Fibrella aquatilis TaxID=2817059 RepID=A0A939G8X2_9BACT|nr:LytTR family DNA-binding domain-containing protein [Fibrella aquatilis]MBO0933155.1 response regulator transcription factor [Fibrella aquatilis]
MPIRCLLVDDEPLAISLLQQHIAQIDALNVVATAPNAIRAMDILRTQQTTGEPIDLLFCDIKMPQLSGVDFLKALTHRPHTILTTAYREFAFDGYDLDVVDYLLKPITFDRFVRAIDRYHRLVHTATTGPHQLDEMATAPPADKSFLHLKVGAKMYRIDPKEVLYLESQKDYVKVVTTGQVITAKATLTDLEHTLSPLGFLRIHRSFLVNLRYLTAYTTADLDIGTHTLPIGALYRDHVLTRLKQP